MRRMGSERWHAGCRDWKEPVHRFVPFGEKAIIFASIVVPVPATIAVEADAKFDRRRIIAVLRQLRIEFERVECRVVPETIVSQPSFVVVSAHTHTQIAISCC